MELMSAPTSMDFAQKIETFSITQQDFPMIISILFIDLFIPGDFGIRITATDRPLLS